MAAFPRTLGLVLVVALASGCFVGSELDNARKLSDGPTKVGDAATAATKPAAGSPAAPKQTAAAKPAAPSGPSWWTTARSLGSEDSQSDIVACKLGSKTEFMTRDDCLGRGGSTP